MQFSRSRNFTLVRSYFTFLGYSLVPKEKLQGKLSVPNSRKMRILLICVFLVSASNADNFDGQEIFRELAEAAGQFFQSSGPIVEGNKLSGQSTGRRQLGEEQPEKKPAGDQIAQFLTNLLGDSRSQNQDSFISTVIDSFLAHRKPQDASRKAESSSSESFDFDSIAGLASSFLGQGSNSDLLMGLMPMLFENFGKRGDFGDARGSDHSGHSWFLPPVLENVHVVWDHFSNSELGQALWKKSGLEKAISQITDKDGTIQYEKLLQNFENPRFRNYWIESLTNHIAEWISHLSEPANQRRYLSTVQFFGNSFLKSQGFPKSAMFDSNKPTESLSRVINIGAKKYLGMKVESMEYIKPAVAYMQELVTLASEKGFIVSRINARELSSRLRETLNNDIIGPILKVYRAYKWSIKSPQCANQILCTLNERKPGTNESQARAAIQKLASFPAAWAVSGKLGVNFWSLYGAISEHDGCMQKYPADCSAFYEEEIRATTESVHSEL